MDATLKQIPVRAQAAGDAGGKQFSAGFQASFSGTAGKIGKAFGLGMATQTLSAASGVIRGDKTIPDAIQALLESVPVIGSVSEFGKTIGNKIFGVDAASDAIKEIERVDAARGAALKRSTDAANRRAENEKQIVSLTAKRTEMSLRDAGQEEAAAKARYDAIAAQEVLAMEHAEQVGAFHKQEGEQLKELSNLRLHLGALELKAAYKNISDRKDAEVAAAKKEAKERAEQVEEATAAAREQAVKDFASFAVGEAQTALGGFKFDAFPPDLQKTIQLRIAKAVEKISGNTETPAGVF